MSNAVFGERVPQTAVCPKDGEPLVMSLERAGYEFVCIICGNWLGFLSPNGATPTPELDARYEELLAQYKAGKRP